jgi:hypothetical protein
MAGRRTRIAGSGWPDANMQPSNINEIDLVAPTGFEPVFGHGHVFARGATKTRSTVARTTAGALESQTRFYADPLGLAVPDALA